MRVGHGLAVSIGTLVLLAALLGRTDPPQVRSTPRVAKPAPHVSTFVPVHAESTSAWTGDEGRPAARAGIERAYLEEFMTRGVDLDVIGSRDAPLNRQIAAVKAAYRLPSEAFYSVTSAALCEENTEAPLREYALRFLLKDAPCDTRSRDVLVAAIRGTACTSAQRSSMLDAILRFGAESEVRGFQEDLLRETDAGWVAVAICAMAANGSQSVRHSGANT